MKWKTLQHNGILFPPEYEAQGIKIKIKADTVNLDVNQENYISKFMAPGYLMVSLGIDWKPKEYFSIMISPLTSKITFVNDDQLAAIGAFGVDPGDKYRAEEYAKEMILNKEGIHHFYTFDDLNVMEIFIYLLKKNIIKIEHFSAKPEKDIHFALRVI